MYKQLKEIEDVDEFNYVVKKIQAWYLGKYKNLNIVTVPYNSTLIFKDIILNLIDEEKKILYIWNGKGVKRKLVNSIKDDNKSVTYEYIESGSCDADIIFVNYQHIDNIRGKYDLVIYDDVSFYSALDNNQIKNIYIKLLERFKKVILYSIEEIDAESEIYLSPLFTEKPFVEPRIINTRVNLNKDIPYILYDYLKWFREEKKRVLLLVHEEEKVECVYDYFVSKLKMDGVEIFKALKNNSESIKNQVLKVKDKSIFIITNNMEVILKDFTVDNAVILFSDNKSFSYKKFLYICAYISKVNKDMPEVLLVSRETSLDMDTAKEISRYFNKLIWEKKSKIF